MTSYRKKTEHVNAIEITQEVIDDHKNHDFFKDLKDCTISKVEMAQGDNTAKEGLCINFHEIAGIGSYVLSYNNEIMRPMTKDNFEMMYGEVEEKPFSGGVIIVDDE